MWRERRPRGGVLWAVIAVTGLTTSFALGCHAKQPRRPRVAEVPRDAAGEVWIGTRHPPVPIGVILLTSATLGSAGQTDFAFHEVSSGAQHLVWLSQQTSRVGAQKPTWTVTDVLVLPEMHSAAVVAIGLCGELHSEAARKPGFEDVSLDPEIVAIARLEDASILTTIERAWRGQRTTGKFMPMSSSGLACLNQVEPHP